MLRSPPHPALDELATRRVRLALSPEALMVHRALIGAGHRNPDLQRISLDSGPGRGGDGLAHHQRH